MELRTRNLLIFRDAPTAPAAGNARIRYSLGTVSPCLCAARVQRAQEASDARSPVVRPIPRAQGGYAIAGSQRRGLSDSNDDLRYINLTPEDRPLGA